MSLPKLQSYKMSEGELKAAKEHLQLQMWYWRDQWSAETLSDMPDWIKHMYYMYGHILWLQDRVKLLEKKYDTATMPKITNGSSYDRPANHVSDDVSVPASDSSVPDSTTTGGDNGVLDTKNDDRDEEPIEVLGGTVVFSGGNISVIQPTEELPDRKDDTEDVGGVRDNRDGL